MNSTWRPPYSANRRDYTFPLGCPTDSTTTNCRSAPHATDSGWCPCRPLISSDPRRKDSSWALATYLWEKFHAQRKNSETFFTRFECEPVSCQTSRSASRTEFLSTTTPLP